MQRGRHSGWLLTLLLAFVAMFPGGLGRAAEDNSVVAAAKRDDLAAVRALISIVSYSAWMNQTKKLRLRAGQPVRHWKQRGRPRTPAGICADTHLSSDRPFPLDADLIRCIIGPALEKAGYRLFVARAARSSGNIKADC